MRGNKKYFFRCSGAVLFLYIFFPSINIKGQGGFKKQYYFNNSLTGKCLDIIEAPNGNIITIGLTVDTLNNVSFNRLTLCITDAQGTKLSEKRYGRPTFQYLDKLANTRLPLLKDASGFYSSMVVRDSNNKYLSTLIRFNFNGDTIWQKKYYDIGTDAVYVYDIAKTVDNALIFSGVFGGTNEQILLIKTDLNGNEKWRKKLPNTPISNGWSAARIIQDSSTKKLIMAGFRMFGPKLCDLILVTDSLGNSPMPQTFFGTSSNGLYLDLVRLKNNTFLAVGNKEVTTSPSQYKSLVLCFNINQSLIWNKLIDTASQGNSFNTVNLLKDGNIIIGGVLDTSFHILQPPKFRLVKMRPDGSLIWKKYYRTLTYAFNSGENQTSLNLTQDGGFLVSTDFIYKSNPRPYSIYKIDSTGCDSTVIYCQSLNAGIVEWQNENAEISIWPNPANSIINIQLAENLRNIVNNNLGGETIVIITDMIGRLIVSEKIIIRNDKTSIDLNVLKNGVYFIKVFTSTQTSVERKLVILK